MSLSKKLTQRASGQSGFSLIELLVVVLIIGILAAIMIPRFLGQRSNAQNSQSVSALTNAKTAADSFYQVNNESYGADAAVGVDGSLAKGIYDAEPSLAPTSTWATLAPGNARDPRTIYVTPTGTERTDGAYMCSVSKGTKWYCIHVDGDAATEYLSGTGALPVYASVVSSGDWDESAKTAGW